MSRGDLQAEGEVAEDFDEDNLAVMVNDVRDRMQELAEKFDTYIPLLEEILKFSRRRGVNRTDASPVMHSLKVESKAETMEEVIRMMAGPLEEMRAATELYTTLDKKISKVDTVQTRSMEYANERILDLTVKIDRANKVIDMQNTEIESLQKRISSKANVSDIEMVNMKLAEKASIATVDKLGVILQGLPSQEDVVTLANRMEKVVENMETYIDNDRLEKIFTERDFAKNTQVAYLERYSRSGLENLNTQFEQMRNYYQKEISNLKKLNYELSQHVAARPWKEEMRVVHDMLDTKASLKQFARLKENISKFLKNSNEYIESFKTEVNVFKETMERFDEILLTKASKDDIVQVRSIIDTHLEYEKFRYTVEPMKAELQRVSLEINKLTDNMSSINHDLDRYGISSESLKKEARDYIALRSILLDVKETVHLKADKSDLLGILDKVGLKEEMEKLSLQLKKQSRQLQNSILLQGEMLKTLIKGADQTTGRQKQRLELYRYATNLIR